jgi:hypothetical protein
VVGAVDVAVGDVERAVVGVVALGADLVAGDLRPVGREHRVEVRPHVRPAVVVGEIIVRERLAADVHVDAVFLLRELDG